jgi:hypothetical protein
MSRSAVSEKSSNALNLALRPTSDMDVDKVVRVKAQVVSGTYEDEEKIDVVVEKLLDILGS